MHNYPYNPLVSKLLGLIHIVSNPAKPPNLTECEIFCGIEFESVYNDKEIKEFLSEKEINKPTDHLKAVLVGYVFARQFLENISEQDISENIVQDLINSILTLLEVQADIDILFKQEHLPEFAHAV